MSEEQKKILEAALDDFSEVGLSQASIESIANRAGLEPAIVRALFIDKETLLKELFKEKTEPLVSAISLAVEEIDDPKELIRKSMEHLDLWLLMHPKVIKLYMRSALEESEVLQTTFQKYLLPSELFERFGQFIAEGKLRCKDVLTLTVLLDSLILLFHMMRPGMMMIDPDLNFEQLARQRFDAAMDLLENGLYTY
ncbi:TetR/AcrR family transcriptional regulator [Acidobacteriota bacterium]